MGQRLTVNPWCLDSFELNTDMESGIMSNVSLEIRTRCIQARSQRVSALVLVLLEFERSGIRVSSFYCLRLHRCLL